MQHPILTVHEGGAAADEVTGVENLVKHAFDLIVRFVDAQPGCGSVGTANCSWPPERFSGDGASSSNIVRRRLPLLDAGEQGP